MVPWFLSCKGSQPARAVENHVQERVTSEGGGRSVRNEGQRQRAKAVEFRRGGRLGGSLQVGVPGEYSGVESQGVASSPRAVVLSLSSTLVSSEELKNQIEQTNQQTTKKHPKTKTQLLNGPHLEQFRFNCSEVPPGHFYH